MTDTKPLSPREKIAKLRAAFVEQLPARIRHAHVLFERLKIDPEDHAAAVDLHRFLHNLKGTGSSFGFQELGAAVTLGEGLVAKLLDIPARPVPENWEQRLSEYLGSIEKAASEACSLFCGLPGCDNPDFTLPNFSIQSVADCSGRLVYICDDEVLTLEKLASQLACFGYESQSFTDTTALLEAVGRRRPDALILDIHFPEGHIAGVEALAEVRRRAGNCDVPAIFLSARSDFAARMAAVQAGGAAYFHKPANVSELVAALDELTHQQQPVPYRIMVVDDEPELASYHSIILQEAGMATYQVTDPSSVLQVLQEFLPDMVLMDMYMPECNGLDLARLIRQVPEHVGLPIIYLSSEPDRKKQFGAMRVGAEGFMTKPVVPCELVATVTILAERMRILRSLMARDSLTGLLNHTTTTHLLQNALATAERAGGSLCLAMMDLDRFKLVNDTHGHLVGDQVLLALSRVLRQRLRSSDIIGRYGGEEFAAILQDITLDRATHLIDELRKDFARVVFHSASGEFSCTFSAGVAGYPAYTSGELLREAADRALYEAKRNGRNCVVPNTTQPGEPSKT